MVVVKNCVRFSCVGLMGCCVLVGLVVFNFGFVVSGWLCVGGVGSCCGGLGVCLVRLGVRFFVGS